MCLLLITLWSKLLPPSTPPLFPCPSLFYSPIRQGENCVEIYATYDTSKVVTSPPYEQYYQPMGDFTTFSNKVCLYKLTKQADATLKFDMCTSNKCE